VAVRLARTAAAQAARRRQGSARSLAVRAATRAAATAAAADYLMGGGVGTTRITTLGRGEGEPVATNDTADGRQQNRRVEIAIYANEEYRESLENGNN
jgi:flagellar motor protein MotB